ncbi:hypothetical protein SAMN04488073_0556 [Marinobacter gudaonensis]|uniref:Uncharacterized protein n=1 Tax=Marinobacter gudaonensis TaxID=375760 RepID=A0A1I6GDW7_9GAMM|nr:hypothetical protein [Marinobacter gudaonensis]SFR40392.1 hypothetical protein SAMN04488073_0556 [Marinobacter gudaonensis]
MNVDVLHLTLIRTSGYLVASGVPMTTANCRTLLAMIDRLLSELEAAGVAEEDLENRLLLMAMDRLPFEFPFPNSQPPEATPALSRGSIGYAAHV